jgi:signal transduction histidine kinase
MSGLPNISRVWRTTPSVALLGAFCLLVAGVTLTLWQEQLYRAQKSREISVQAQILGASVTAALIFDDNRTAQDYVNALAVNPDIEAAGVYDEAGALFAGFSRPAAIPPPQRVEPREPWLEDNRLHTAPPVVQDGTRVGGVYLRAITESLAQRIARYGAIMILATMAALLVLVLAAAHRTLSRANRELEAQAVDLAETNRKLTAEIEEREKAEAALRQSQKMEAIGQLSGGIAHDFNNLLTIVKGNLQLLERRMSQGRTDVQRYVASAFEGLNRAATLTQRLLAFSRLQPLSPQPVNLSRLIRNMVDLLRHSVGDRIEIDCHLDADWWTLCDPHQMENVIINLAVNARDAMPEGGRLRIETSNLSVENAARFEGVARGQYIQLTVTDTGSGMPEEVLRKAIDPFFTTKPQGQGTGLGLSTSFGYVRQSNGHFHIQSEVGKGTIITILMPRHEIAVPQAQQAMGRQ